MHLSTPSVLEARSDRDGRPLNSEDHLASEEAHSAADADGVSPNQRVRLTGSVRGASKKPVLGAAGFSDGNDAKCLVTGAVRANLCHVVDRATRLEIVCATRIQSRK